MLLSIATFTTQQAFLLLTAKKGQSPEMPWQILNSILGGFCPKWFGNCIISYHNAKLISLKSKDSYFLSICENIKLANMDIKHMNNVSSFDLD